MNPQTLIIHRRRTAWPRPFGVGVSRALGLSCILAASMNARAQQNDPASIAEPAPHAAAAANRVDFWDEGQAATARNFHCDGTDPALFQEMDEAGWLGYGETWDLHTCGEGAQAFVAGMNPRWRAWRSPRGREKRQQEMSFYAAFFPFVAFGGIGSMFGVAWILAMIQRRRRTPRQFLFCADCDISIPVSADDPGLRNAFCPACGRACELLAEDPAATLAQTTAG